MVLNSRNISVEEILAGGFSSRFEILDEKTFSCLELSSKFSSFCQNVKIKIITLYYTSPFPNYTTRK